MKRITLLQSNYLPWRGYFDFMAKSDEFIVYDSCQYTVNDWRNRNQVKMRDGVRWITVPVVTKGRFGQRITEAEVVDHKWAKTHLATITTSLSKAPFAKEILDLLGECYAATASTPLLHEINVRFLGAVHAYLGFKCRVTDDSAYDVETLADLSPSAKVAELVHRAGGTRVPHRTPRARLPGARRLREPRHRRRRARLLDARAVPAALRRLRRPPLGDRPPGQRRHRSRADS